MNKEVQYGERLVQFLEARLSLTFHPQYLKLSRRTANSGDRFYVQIVDAPSVAHLDDGAEQGVVEILPDDRPSTFYLGFVAPFEFKAKNQYTLHSVSLSVFHRVVEDLVPMFRAEWDRQDASSSSDHGQPHWHFVQSPERIESIVRRCLRAEGETFDFNPSPQDSPLFTGIADCRRFHFAMTSLWNKADALPHKRVFDSDDFRTWFDSLTAYVANQLRYVADKMPTTSTAFTVR